MRKVNTKNKMIVLKQYNKITKEWDRFATVWASFIEPDISMVDIANNPTSAMTRRMCIWYRDDVKKDQKAYCGKRVFDILHVYPSRDNSELFVICRELVM